MRILAPRLPVPHCPASTLLTLHGKRQGITTSLAAPITSRINDCFRPEADISPTVFWDDDWAQPETVLTPRCGRRPGPIPRIMRQLMRERIMFSASRHFRPEVDVCHARIFGYIHSGSGYCGYRRFIPVPTQCARRSTGSFQRTSAKDPRACSSSCRPAHQNTDCLTTGGRICRVVACGMRQQPRRTL